MRRWPKCFDEGLVKQHGYMIVRVVHGAGPESDIAIEVTQLLVKEKAWIVQECRR